MNLNTLAVHHGDADIKLMLAQAGITIQRPPPPNDMAVTCCQSAGYHWLVLAFFEKSDPGYVAYGLPEGTPQHEVLAAWKFIMGTVEESAAEMGIDCFAHADFVPMPEPTVN